MLLFIMVIWLGDKFSLVILVVKNLGEGLFSMIGIIFEDFFRVVM